MKCASHVSMYSLHLFKLRLLLRSQSLRKTREKNPERKPELSSKDFLSVKTRALFKGHLKMVGKKQYNSYIYNSSKPPLRSFQGKYYGGQSSKVEVPAMDFPTQPTYKERRTLYATFNHLKPEVSRHEILRFFWSEYGDVVDSVVMAEETPPLHAWITFYTPEIAEQIMAEGPPPLKLWMKGGKSMWLKPFFP